MKFILSFIPLFVAIDVMGLLPVYVGLTEGMALEARRRVVNVASITAISVAVFFIFLGELVFQVLGVTSNDFRIAGGILLLVFAIQDLTVGGKPRRVVSPTLAVVPLGMPLIVGPGVLTTVLLVVHQYGYVPTLAAFAANMAIVYVSLRLSDPILRLVGPAVAAAAAKIASLFLASIAIMMLRKGLLETIQEFLKTVESLPK